MIDTKSSLPIISEQGLRRKMEKFGLTHLNYKEMLPTFPRVRFYDKDVPRESAYKWCEENISDSWIWSSLYLDHSDIYFIDQADAVMFKLKFKTY